MFSVIIPLYNKQDFVGRALDSVFHQQCQNFEIIVVDDGSTDESVERVLAYDDPRLRLLRQGNCGVGRARNNAISHSGYPWLALLDADDFWFPDHLTELARIIEKFPAVGMAATSYLEGEDPDPLQPSQRACRIAQIDYFREAARNVGVVWSSAVALRKSVVGKVGGFEDYRNGEDLHYWARMALSAPVARSSRVTAYYFRNDQSVMSEIHRNSDQADASASLFDLWPSVAYLESIKRMPEHAMRRTAIEQYQRKAAYLTMTGLLARDEVQNARRVAQMLPGWGFDSATLLSLAMRLPAALVRSLLAARRLLRPNSNRSI